MNFVFLISGVFAMLAKCTVAFVLAQQHKALQKHNTEAAAGAAELVGDTFVFERVYESIASLHDTSAMLDFVKRLLVVEDKFVAKGRERELTGFVQSFADPNSGRDFKQMREELSSQSWVKDLKTIDGSSLSEADYQAVASHRNDTAMSLLVRALVRSKSCFIPEEESDQLAGFVHWYSGTKAIQTLDKMQLELFAKPWVRPLKAMTIAPEAPSTATVRGSSKRGGATDWSQNQHAKPREMLHSSGSIGAIGAETKESLDDVESVPKQNCPACIVWGAANILPFNAYRNRAKAHPKRLVELYARTASGDQFSVFKAGTYWLVHSDKVQIQGRYWQYSQSKLGLILGAIAIGGPMVGNNTLIVRALAGPVMWNGQQILDRAPSNFSNSFVQAKFVSDVGLVAGGSHVAGVKFKFKNGVRFTVARYNKQLAAHISLCDSDAGDTPIQGQCGNLENMPAQKAHVWREMQRAAKKLPRSEHFFSKGLQGPSD